MKLILTPDQVRVLVDSGQLASPQPKGAMRIVCDAHRHPIIGDTESPDFWEAGDFVHCNECGTFVLARIIGPDFEIDLSYDSEVVLVVDGTDAYGDYVGATGPDCVGPPYAVFHIQSQQNLAWDLPTLNAAEKLRSLMLRSGAITS